MDRHSSPLFLKHSDIMNAQPETPEEKQRLVAEIKSRANFSFKNKSLEEAEALYTHALTHVPNDVVLLGNRSAARCAMGKLDLALEDALECIELNPAWVKGFFRKGQALKAMKRFGEAFLAFQHVVELEPSNKSALQHMTDAKKHAEAMGQALDHVTDTVTVTTDTVTDTQDTSTKTLSTASAEGSKPKPKKKASSSDVMKGTDVVDLANVRGYKKLADGRTTTYFNNELSEEDKKLIGDIAPKKIEKADDVKIQNVDGGSAWNQGSTFEERDMTRWATDRITQVLSSVEYKVDNGPEEATVIRVKTVADVTGDASIAVFRGKKRYLFDLTFTVECVGNFGDLEPPTVDGKLKFLDFSSDGDDDYEADVIVPQRYQTEAGKMMYQHLANSKSEFRASLLKHMKQFVDEYGAM